MMPRKSTHVTYANDVLMVRTRRGTVYAYVTVKKARKTVRIACPAFDFMASVMVAEDRIKAMFPGALIIYDTIQVERGVAYGGFD